MRSFFFTIALLIACSISPVWAQTATFHAGIARISVSTEEAFDTLVWYPTQAEEVPWQAGPFATPASRDAAIAPGQFPVVLLSHGGGQTGSSPLLLRELSAYLARQGFIVVAPFHGKTRLLVRTRQVKAALDAMMADPRFKPHAASDKLGMLGFSLGGAVALGLSGGIPNFRQLAVYCSAHPDDVQSCSAGPGGDRKAAPAPQAQPPAKAPPIPRLPLKGLVLLDPFDVLFDRDGLTEVNMPVLLIRPKQSKMGEANTRALEAGLPQPPKLEHVPGGHFIFTDICLRRQRSSRIPPKALFALRAQSRRRGGISDGECKVAGAALRVADGQERLILATGRYFGQGLRWSKARHAIPDDAHLLAGHAGQYVGEKAWDARLMSREKLVLNGIYLDEIQAPKPEFHDQAEQGTQALADPGAG
jgi:predicted dienelactone hydrolase